MTATYYLQKTLTTNGNSFGFSGTNIQINFDPAISKVTENLKKSYGAKVLRPYSRSNYGNQASKTMLIDLKQIEWTWTIEGVLSNDTGNITSLSPSTTDTAVAKMHVLMAMAEQGGTMTFAHRNNTSTETVNIISMQFEDVESEVTLSSAEDMMKGNEVRIRFTIVLQKGQDR